MKTGRHHHRRGRGSRLAWVTSLTVHFFLLTFAVGAILPPVIPASEDLPVADRPLTIRWVPSQQATVRTEAEPPIEKEPLGNVFSPNSVFRLKVNRADLERNCFFGDDVCTVEYDFHSYAEEECQSNFVCAKVPILIAV